MIAAGHGARRRVRKPAPAVVSRVSIPGARGRFLEKCMSLILSCRDLAKAHGTENLFENLSLSIFAGDHLGLIGPNGVGKSTLLRILADQDSPDAGEVVVKRHTRLVYVPQVSNFDPGHTVYEIAVAAGRSLGLPEEEAIVAAQIQLSRAEFEDFEALTETLSGGWKKRWAIACALVGEPECLLLDEPTNHLDVAGVLWLESLLSASDFTWITVSHDRYFLENTVNKIAELNPVFPEGILFCEGGYDTFLSRKADLLEAQAKFEQALVNKLRRETEWLRRQPKARTTKAKYRVDQAARLMETYDEVRTRRQISDRVDMSFSSSDRKTKKLIEVKGVGKHLGDKRIVEGLEFLHSPGRRIGLLGTNGTGKTTILKLILGELAPDQGTVRHAEQLQAVYFDQNRQGLDAAESLKRSLSPAGDSVIYKGRSLHVISWAKRFRFAPEQLETPVGSLSGGEQARLLLARLMLVQADVLLLDEPTNDLDIPSLEELEEALEAFPGAVVLVSHDRYLLRRVCNGFIGLDGKGGWAAYGSYEQWERELQVEEEPKARKEKPVSSSRETAAKPTSRKKLSYNEQREFDGMEETILVEEERIESLKAEMALPETATDAGRLQELFGELNDCQKKVEALYARWAELEAKIT